MTPVGVFIGLLIMTVSIIVPGFLISKMLVKGCTKLERFGFSLGFGTMTVYIVYLFVKDDIFIFDWSVIALSYIVILGAYIFRKDARDRIFSWFLTD